MTTRPVPDTASIREAAKVMSRWGAQRIVNYFAIFGALLGMTCLSLTLMGVFH